VLSIIKEKNTSTTLIYSYAIQALWLAGIKLDNVSIDVKYLDLRYLKINKEEVINTFVLPKRREAIIEEIYYAWGILSPYVIDYIMKKVDLTRSSVCDLCRMRLLDVDLLTLITVID
jgi:hypothetical protein